MAESDESKVSPPYGSFGTFWNYVTGLKAETLPPQLDRTMMRGKSGSDQTVINMGLKFFGLVDPDNHNAVLDSLKDLVAADTDKRKAILADLVRTRYPEQMKISEQLGTEKLLHESFGTAFGLTGETRRKASTFFLHAAAMADITVSPNFPKARSGQGRPAGGVSKKAAPRNRAGKSAANTKDGNGDTYSITLQSGGTVQLIVNADLMALLRHDADRKLVTELIEKMEGYETAVPEDADEPDSAVTEVYGDAEDVT
jgi:hypothetical protein